MSGSTAEAFAYLVDELVDVADYQADATGGNVFLFSLPSAPERAFRVATYGGGEASALHGYDEPNVQVWVRGPRGDALTAERDAQAVYDALHGLERRELAGGVRLHSCTGNQSGPVWVGQDTNGLPEFSVNFRVELRRITGNRK